MRRLVWVSIVMLTATATFAQSLAEVAKKEKERREKLESSDSRTITDVELRRAGGPRTLPTAASTTATEDDEATAEGEETDDGQDTATDARQNEQYWRGRLEPIDARIQRLEEQLNSPQFTMNPTGAGARQQLEQRLGDARAERQAVLDEARRAGVPPGWLR